jgi:O-antigen ligase
MLERLGIKDTHELREGIVWVCLVLLVAVTPAGNEATSPLVLGLYRTLLLLIVIFYAAWTDKTRLPRLSSYFVGALAALSAVMLISILRWQGSLFEGFYAFYEHILFIAAFVALAHASLGRSTTWKHAVLGAVVLIDVAYIAGALALDQRPLLGPFVNPNYLGSFVLPGLAICTATVVLSSSLRLRIAAASAGLFLYYGIGQTASRGAILAGLALLGLAVFRSVRRRGISLVRMALLAGLLLTVTAAFNPALVRKFLDRGERDPYNYQRGAIWMGTLAMIGEHPATGVGLGHFSYVAKRFAPPVESTIGRYRRWPNIAHSEFLQYVAEIGIPGALLLFGLGAGLLMCAWRRAENANSPDEPNKIVQESALLAAAGLCVHALVDNNWTVPVLAAGLAVIAQADLLPHKNSPARAAFPGIWRHALALLFLAVWVDAALVPAIGMHFNEVGHAAHLQKNYEGAERNHRFALAVIPGHPVLLDNLGIVYLDRFLATRKTEYLDRAEIAFAEAMDENPSFDVPAAHLESALMQRLTENPQKDLPIHRKIIAADQRMLQANPFNPFIRKNLAEAFYNLGDRHQAREELLKAIEIEPNYVPAYLRLAAWYEEAGQMEEGARYRKQALQIVNRYKDTRNLDSFDALLLGRPLHRKHP